MEAVVSFASYLIYKVRVRFRVKEIWKERPLLIRNKWNDVSENEVGKWMERNKVNMNKLLEFKF